MAEIVDYDRETVALIRIVNRYELEQTKLDIPTYHDAGWSSVAWAMYTDACEGLGRKPLGNGAPAIKPEISISRRALENIYMFALRHRRKENGAAVATWDTVVRFCEEAGCSGNILREELPATTVAEEINTSGLLFPELGGLYRQIDKVRSKVGKFLRASNLKATRLGATTNSLNDITATDVLKIAGTIDRVRSGGFTAPSPVQEEEE